MFEIIIATLILAGLITDIKKKLLPNWCTVSIFLLGVGSHVYYDGLNGLTNAFSGALCFVTIYMLLAMKFKIKLGCGDWKLLIALGAYTGWSNLGLLLPVYLLVNSLMELIYLAYTNKVFNPLKFFCFAAHRLKAEIYNYAEPTKKIYGPFIGIPFICFMLIKYFNGVI